MPQKITVTPAIKPTGLMKRPEGRKVRKQNLRTFLIGNTRKYYPLLQLRLRKKVKINKFKIKNNKYYGFVCECKLDKILYK